MDKNKVRQFFNEWALSWDENLEKDPEIIRTLMNEAKVAKGKDILDVACGTGVLIEDYLEREVASIIGIDLSDEMIAIARRKYPEVEFICADAETFTSDKRFDCIVIYDAFPHFADPEKLLENLSGLLKEEGTLTIAHSASRERINAHHHNAMDVSRMLPEISELQKTVDRYLEVISCIANEKMYLLTAQKRSAE